MNRPIFPRIPEARRRAQERASMCARTPIDQPASMPAAAPAASRETTHPLRQGQGTTDAPLEPGAPDDSGAP